MTVVPGLHDVVVDVLPPETAHSVHEGMLVVSEDKRNMDGAVCQT
jgi:hypothetical protein